MVKLGLEIKEDGEKINIKLTDPSKKQLETASENELFIAQNFKELFDEKLIILLEEKTNKK